MEEYDGIERRQFQRRNTKDRRHELRWEPEKIERRRGLGRRRGDRFKLFSL